MIASLKIWDDENATSGRIEIYHRKSFTCRVLVGTLKFEDKAEKETLMDMLVKYHPEVEIIPNDMTTGNFTEVYFK